jgi:hypothetical protein
MAWGGLWPWWLDTWHLSLESSGAPVYFSDLSRPSLGRDLFVIPRYAND